MRKARILVVEDEGLVALSIQKFLTILGYEVDPLLESGEAAVDAVRLSPPDLVLMDIRLEGAIDGIEAANRIMSRHRVPVVFLTSYSDEATVSRARLTAPFGYVTKPFDEQSLRIVLEMALAKSRDQNAIIATKEELEAIVESVEEGIVKADNEGVVQYVNGAARRLLRAGQEELETTLSRLLRLRDSQTREDLSPPFDRAVKRGEPVRFEDVLLVTHDNGRLPVDLTLTPVRDTESSRGMVVVFRDISERRRAMSLFAGEQKRASSLYANLLPPSGRSAVGVEMRCIFHPATIAAGDLYNFFSLDDSHVAIYLLDVEGHGISAAALSILIHRLLSPGRGQDKRYATIDADPYVPLEVVDHLNRLLYDSAHNLFFTIVYGVIDVPKRSLRLVRAGHPYPLRQRTNGTVEEIRVEGTAVGLGESPSLVEEEFVFDRGERLYFYSDGIVECANPQMEQFSRLRLAELIERSRTETLEHAVVRIDEAVCAWNAKPAFDDDVSLIAVEMPENV